MSRLLYTMTSQDGLDVDAGSIDIFIAQNNTPLPSANNFVHPIPAIIGEEITVDVNEHISNTELRPLSLSSVTVFDASATLAKENDPVCETCFNFKATKQGVFKVNYVINDQEQNYASAIVTINVNKPWKNITTGIYNKLFSAPLDETDAKNLAISISSFDLYPTISQLKIPRFTHAVAASFCISKGKRLPYKDELIDLFNLRAQSRARS